MSRESGVRLEALAGNGEGAGVANRTDLIVVQGVCDVIKEGEKYLKESDYHELCEVDARLCVNGCIRLLGRIPEGSDVSDHERFVELVIRTGARKVATSMEAIEAMVPKPNKPKRTNTLRSV